MSSQHRRGSKHPELLHWTVSGAELRYIGTQLLISQPDTNTTCFKVWASARAYRCAACRLFHKVCGLSNTQRNVAGAAHNEVLAVLFLQAVDHTLGPVRAAVVHYHDLEVLATVGTYMTAHRSDSVGN